MIATFSYRKLKFQKGVSSMDVELTKKQKLILDFINDFQEKNGFPPTVRDICIGVGLRSTATVFTHLKNLEEKGVLNKSSAKNRAISVVKDATTTEFVPKASEKPEILEVPLIGKVAAGSPILAVENIERTFPLPVDMATNQDMFMLRVQGESMINAGILNGDFIIVARQPTAENGEKVVAMINDEVTVKTFYKENGFFRLQPENDTMEPIITTQLTILGKVVGLFRNY
ncbi:MAG: transcriptional repressor LexA [Ruminococcaceae bacterium]|nr:transcriptional repressor LexA [Oscillospiraceae bacterium]